MADDPIDDAAAAFERAIDPAPQPKPRDTGGRFAAVAERPEPIFETRMVEGDPETGDTRDGGDNVNLRERERDIADGRYDERAEAEGRARNRRDATVSAADDEGAEDLETGSDAGDDVDAAPGDGAEEGPSYEITVDGEPATVSLRELQSGYIREATFHSRLNKVSEQRNLVDQENQRVSQMRDIFIQGLTFLDEDLRGMAEPEPNWDEEYAKDPLAARRKQKQYQIFYTKLNDIRQKRAWAIENGRQEHDRQTARYALEQFTQFVQRHPKLFKDESSLQRIIGGMRQHALNKGFNEQEVAGVYDSRMLDVLLESFLYTRGMAVKPQAVIPGKGKSLVPGSATPIGNAGRRNIDEAQRTLARTGRVEDAETFFHRLLR